MVSVLFRKALLAMEAINRKSKIGVVSKVPFQIDFKFSHRVSVQTIVTEISEGGAVGTTGLTARDHHVFQDWWNQATNGVTFC